jgi:hypothetical protein
VGRVHLKLNDMQNENVHALKRTSLLRLVRSEEGNPARWLLLSRERLMDELVPVILGVILGVANWLTTSGKTRFVLSLLAVMVSGLIATVASGEYHQSWIYLLLDFGEAALGLVVGYVVAARLLTPSSAGRAARREGEAP